MVLKRLYFFVIIFILFLFPFYGLDLKSCDNPFDISELKFEEDGIVVKSQKIICTESDVIIDYCLLNTTSHSISLPIKIECKDLGFQTLRNDIIIPYAFNICMDNSIVDYDVYSKNLLVPKAFYYSNCESYSEGMATITFNVLIPSMKESVLQVSYKNLQNAGNNQTGTNFVYKIKLQKNSNNKKVDYSFNYCALQTAKLYINNIGLYDKYNEDFIEINNNVERSYSSKNIWTYKLSTIFESNDIYLIISLRVFDLSLDITDIRLFSYKDILTLFLNEKNLRKEQIESREIFYLTNNQLSFLRNSFYAMHGYDFKNQTYKSFFSNYKWYKVSPNFSESDFNEIEKKNIAIIKELENIKEPILLLDYLE